METNVTSLVQPLREDGPLPLHRILARNVGRILGEHGLSRASLARAIGMSGPGLTMKLNGKRPVDLTDLELLAAALGVKPTDLLLPQMDSNHQPSD
ncbi:helix-turn-helix domain-containing protein [Serinibacter salmoneus]|uniref:helix-turn-helix domain-containing protein n=1 Tax=Serinibacter salmoneus TaxID=556530 RepID=UPI000BF569B8